MRQPPANRDERVFVEPGRLGVGRDPNRQLAFVQGVRDAVAAPLARLEAHIAFGALPRRASGLHLRLPANSVRRKRGVFLHSLRRLPVAF